MQQFACERRRQDMLRALLAVLSHLSLSLSHCAQARILFFFTAKVVVDIVRQRVHVTCQVGYPSHTHTHTQMESSVRSLCCAFYAYALV